MGTIDILSPVALGPAEAHPVTPPLPGLRGRIVGIRVDHAWHSFQVFADEVRGLLGARCGVRDVVFFDPDTRIGTPEAESGKVAAFARGVEAAVVGLGT